MSKTKTKTKEKKSETKKTASKPEGTAASASSNKSENKSTDKPAKETKTMKTNTGTIQNGKGSAPRNMSAKFLKNYQGISWDSEKKRPMAGTKFVKVY